MPLLWLLLLALLLPLAAPPTSARPAVAVTAFSAPASRADRPDTLTRPGQQTQEPPLAVIADAASNHRAIVRVGAVLRGGEIEHAARSGLPVRVRIRVELWKDRFFDQLVDSTSWLTYIVFEPIGEQFFVRNLPAAGGVRRFSSFAAARQTVEDEYLLSLRPRGSGRYYYTASLQIERLSLSDIEELERWLQGELQPAVSGQRSLPNALGQGAKRLVLRLLDIPTRRYDARSGSFTIEPAKPG